MNAEPITFIPTATEFYALHALLATEQWGETIEEVARRLFEQRIWQITGENCTEAAKIGAHLAPRGVNQVTKAE